jgi:hypothetical protein
MSLHLQRIRFSVRTKNQLFAGTNSKVQLVYTLDDDHAHPTLEPGAYSLDLDQPFYDDLQRGHLDSYLVELAQGSSGRAMEGVPVPNGVTFRDADHLRSLDVRLVIHGSDQWILDRYMLAGYLQELRAAEGCGSPEVVDHGWVELARHEGDLAMSTSASEGVAEHRIDLAGAKL